MRFLIGLLTFIVLFASIFAPLALAPAPSALAAPTLDELLPYEGIGKTRKDSEVGTGVALPKKHFLTELVPDIVKLILALSGTLLFVGLVAAGVMLVVAHDNEELVTRAKNIFMYSIIGIIFVVTAYAIVFGIATLSFE